MRLFVAVPVPPHVRAALVRATADVQELAPVGTRWTAPEQMHVTLAFLGEVGERSVDEVRERVARAVGRASRFALTCVGVRRFGARVLAARVEADEPAALAALALSVTAAARHAGLVVDDRPYRPHVTLARASGSVDLRPLTSALAALRTDTWRPATVDLVRSTLGTGPGRTAEHAVVEAWPLGPD